jgi:hypothetical protein
MSTRRGAGLLALGLAVSLAAGCGGGTSKVHGKVTHAGKPVVWGSVTLVDSSGAYHQSLIDLNGNYEIANVPAGPVKIAVVSPNPDPASHGGDPGGRGGPRPKGGPGSRGGTNDPREKFLAQKGIQKAEDDRPRPPAAAWFPIDRKFADPNTSGLTGEVKPGATELSIDLK